MDAIKWFSTSFLLSMLLITLTHKVHCDAKDSYTFPESVHLEDGDEFEYIVVGAGAAGAAAASRLALAGASVLLVEAGGDPTELSKIPSEARVIRGSSLDYQYRIISNNKSCLSAPNGQCRYRAGKCFGGSTSINGMLYIRGNPQDFDDFNITRWAWKDMMPYFLRYEGLQDLDLLPPSSIPFHNTSGTMKMEFFSDPDNPWHARVIEGLKSLNFPFNPDVNARSQIGVTKVVGFVYDGARMSTARGYLARDDVKKKLKVAKHTKCTSVIIDDDNIARGVTVVVGSGLIQSRLSLYATKEVILSAGAIATPQILMLSGIGPAEHLRDMDIPVRVDLSVGDGMYDHVGSLIFLKVENKTWNLNEWLSEGAKVVDSLEHLLLYKDSPLTSIDLNDVIATVNTMCYDFDKHQVTNNSAECLVPTLQLEHSYVDRYFLNVGGALAQHAGNFDDAVFRQLSDVNKSYAMIVITSIVLHLKSRGTVRLTSRDPLAAPAIFPNYFSEELDLEEMIRSIRIVEHLVETPVYKAQNSSILHLELVGCPKYEMDSEAYWRCYARHVTQAIFHATGTTALGRVVDERLRVRGVQRLRVGDLGVLPRPPRANTGAAAIAVGERLVDFVMEDNKET